MHLLKIGAFNVVINLIEDQDYVDFCYWWEWNYSAICENHDSLAFSPLSKFSCNDSNIRKIPSGNWATCHFYTSWQAGG